MQENQSETNFFFMAPEFVYEKHLFKVGYINFLFYLRCKEKYLV